MYITKWIQIGLIVPNCFILVVINLVVRRQTKRRDPGCGSAWGEGGKLYLPGVIYPFLKFVFFLSCLPTSLLCLNKHYILIYFNPTGTCDNMKWAVCDGSPCQCTLQFADDDKRPINCTNCEFSSRFALELFNKLPLKLVLNIHTLGSNMGYIKSV